MSSFPWRKAWKPRGTFAALTPGCRAWYHVLCAELADDDGTVQLVEDGRSPRALTNEIGRRLGAPTGERRVLGGYLRTLLELELLVVDEGGKRLVVVHWEDEQEGPKTSSPARPKAPKPPRPKPALVHEPRTSSERTPNELQTNLERDRNEIEDKPTESLDTARESRGEEKREEERVSRADARPPTPSGPSIVDAPDEPTAASRFSIAFVRAVNRATGHEPHMAHRHGAVLDLLRRIGRVELLAELDGFERWLTTARKRPGDPWLRFCDRVGTWNESKVSGPAGVDWAAAARRSASDEADLFGREDVA